MWRPQCQFLHLAGYMVDMNVDRWVLVKENPCFQGHVHILYFCHQGYSIYELIVQTLRWQRTEVIDCKPGDREPSLHTWLQKLHTFCAHAHQSNHRSLLQISHSWLFHSYSIRGLTCNSSVCYCPGIHASQPLFTTWMTKLAAPTLILRQFFMTVL